jgi:isoleucyl-tRNA synthetase
LWAGGADLKVLRQYEEQLPALFIVSGVRLWEDLDACVAEAAAQTFAVTMVLGETGEVVGWVEPAEGEKCGRCWMRRPEVGTDAEHPELCARCADRVRRLGN